MDAGAWDARYAAAESLWSREPNRFFVREAEALPAGRALDLACGEGRNALWLAQRGWRVTAVDFSEVALSRGRERAHRSGVEVDWVAADVVEWTPAPRAFDLVAIVYLHLVWERLSGVLRAAADAVAPGGVLLVVAHDPSNLTEGVGGPQDPALLHGPEDLAAALPGLRIDRAERVRRPVETPAGRREAIDVLVRAVRDDA